MSKLSYQSIRREMAWGMASEACCYVYYPKDKNELMDIFELAKSSGMTVGFRGAGQSYGDASLNGEQILVDLSGWNRILDWDSENGSHSWWVCINEHSWQKSLAGRIIR